MLWLLLLLSPLIFAGCLRKKTVSPSGAETQVIEHPTKKVKDLTFAEALQARTYYKQNGQEDLAVKSLERAIKLCENHVELEMLILELADLLLETGDFEKSQRLYKEFKNFYPGSKHLEYALYQEVMSHHLACLSSDRDQTQTHETITLAQAFTNRFKESQYVSSVNTILTVTYRTLFEHELNQVEFYLNKLNYEPQKGPVIAACNRLNYISQQVLPHMKDIDIIERARIETLINHLGQLACHEQSATYSPVKLAQDTKEVSSIMLALRSMLHTPAVATSAPHPRDRF